MSLILVNMCVAMFVQIHFSIQAMRRPVIGLDLDEVESVMGVGI